MFSSPKAWPAQVNAALLSFFLTLAVAAVIAAALLGPGRLPELSERVDTEVVVIFVPLLALILTIFVEAVRQAARGAPERAIRRQRLDWRRHRA